MFNQKKEKKIGRAQGKGSRARNLIAWAISKKMKKAWERNRGSKIGNKENYNEIERVW